jgi:hypothetical protein
VIVIDGLKTWDMHLTTHTHTHTSFSSFSALAISAVGPPNH